MAATRTSTRARRRQSTRSSTRPTPRSPSTASDPDPSVVDEDYTVKWTVSVNTRVPAPPPATWSSATMTATAHRAGRDRRVHLRVDLGRDQDADRDLRRRHDLRRRRGHREPRRRHAPDQHARPCSPLSIVVAEDTTCTVTVTDTETRGDKSDPEGTVTFSLPDTLGLLDMGTFDPLTADCTLDSDGVAGTYTSSCTVVYTPSAKGDGQHTIDAAYDGSATHTASADTVGVTVQVDWRATSTTVTCETPVVVGQPSTCSVVVADASANGVASIPQERSPSRCPAWTSAPSPRQPPSAPSRATRTAPATARSRTPDRAWRRRHNIGAAYDSDEDVHADSSDATGFTLLVNKADTTTTIDTDDPDRACRRERDCRLQRHGRRPGAGSPTGLVTVTDANSLQTCSATVLAGSCEIAFAADGTHHLTATTPGMMTSTTRRARRHRPRGSHPPHQHGRRLHADLDRGRQLTTCTVTVTDDEPWGRRPIAGHGHLQPARRSAPLTRARSARPAPAPSSATPTAPATARSPTPRRPRATDCTRSTRPTADPPRTPPAPTPTASA